MLSELHLPSACQLPARQAAVTSGDACCADCARLLGTWTGKNLLKASAGWMGCVVFPDFRLGSCTALWDFALRRLLLHGILENSDPLKGKRNKANSSVLLACLAVGVLMTRQQHRGLEAGNRVLCFCWWIFPFLAQLLSWSVCSLEARCDRRCCKPL